MFLGLREHEMRSNPCIIGVKIPFDPNIIMIPLEEFSQGVIMKNFEILSLELHLFFARIMKEHSLFLEAGFQGKDCDCIKRAGWFRSQFEQVLEEAVRLSEDVFGIRVLESGEVVTEFTASAEKKTSQLTGIPINFQITADEQCLKSGGACTEQGERCSKAGSRCGDNRKRMMEVRALNQRALRLVCGLIDFKEGILADVTVCKLYTANYPLLIKHIIREAKLYQSFLRELEMHGTISPKCIRETEMFWNQIMMEHALFIRGLLDPSEEELIEAANGFAGDYKGLLAEAKKQDCRTMDDLTRKTLEETEKYRDFKKAGTKGITECEISSLILPLLADHVLREANHYLRILENTCGKASEGCGSK